MNMELEPNQSCRHRLAIASLRPDIRMIDLAGLLLQACQEVLAEGKDPEYDPAVAVISGRIGFMSPTDSMSTGEWNALVAACHYQSFTPLKLNPEVLN